MNLPTGRGRPLTTDLLSTGLVLNYLEIANLKSTIVPDHKESNTSDRRPVIVHQLHALLAITKFIKELVQIQDPMDSEKIILTKEIFRVLASETRVTILKKLAQRRMTISELSRELKKAKSTVHEHLVLMTTAGLIIPVPDEHQWKYYEITRKGTNLLLPENSVPITILLSLMGFLFLAGALAAFVFAWLSIRHEAVSVPIHGAGYTGYSGPDLFSAGIGILLLITGILIFIRLFRIRASFNADKGTLP